MIIIDKTIAPYRVKGRVRNQVATGQMYKISDKQGAPWLLIAQWSMSTGVITIVHDYPDTTDLEEIIRQAIDSSIIPASDYNALINKPKINGVILKGNKSAADLGLIESDEVENFNN